jgi:phytoene dehydrogenase-like protein
MERARAEGNQGMTAERFDVIVVGAGFGGATCAALLAKRGLRVLLLEKNSQAGGKAMVISKNGFTYEMWPVIHAPARSSRCLQVLRELGVEDRVALAVPEARGGIYFDAAGEVRRFPNDPDPDGTKILRLLGVAEHELPKAIQVLAELALLPPAESAKLDEVSFTQWLEEKGAPAPVRMYLHALANGVFMVPSDVLPASEAIRTLQEIMLQHGGLYAASGGIGRLAEIYADTVEENGGRVVYRARVRAIEVEAGRVTGVRTDQGSFCAPIVVSNAGLQTTVLKLVGEQHFDKSYANWVRDLVPSWGMIGLRYFLDTELLDEPYALVFSEQAYWTSDRWLEMQAGAPLPREVIMWVQVPSQNNPDLAPPGKQCVLTGTWCSPDPDAPIADKERWWRKIDEIMERTWPGFHSHVESRETYDARDASGISREPAFAGVGGECIGLGQVIGQCGRFKPDASAPIAGLFYVGVDAGAYGCGTHQAVESGIKVADLVWNYQRVRRAVFGAVEPRREETR